MADFPEKERELWRIFDETPFEDLLAAENLEPDDVLRLIGALLFARSLSNFKVISRKSLRIIKYKGCGKTETEREHNLAEGYASAVDKAISYISALLPEREVIESTFRRVVSTYPEITNPGKPLVDTERFLDNPPRSRNEEIASLMRRIGACAERGSGIDKVVSQTELFFLPAPKFEIAGEHTRVTLFAFQSLNEMSKEDRIRACYLHACLRYTTHSVMTNTSVRERFGIESRNSATASRLIQEALAAGVIRAVDENAAQIFQNGIFTPFFKTNFLKIPLSHALHIQFNHLSFFCKASFHDICVELLEPNGSIRKLHGQLEASNHLGLLHHSRGFLPFIFPACNIGMPLRSDEFRKLFLRQIQILS